MPRNTVPLPLLAVTGASFFLAFFILNPGIMSFDSLVTWQMSETLRLTDNHPPAYTLTLRLLRHLWNSPGIMVLFNVGVFSLGSLLLAEVVRRRSWVGYLVPLTIFLPFVLNFIGVLWKDTALAVCWWTAAAIAVYVYDTKGSRHAPMAVAYGLFTFGLLVRHNAVTAAPFLLFALVVLHIGAAGSLKRGLAIFAGACVVSLVLLQGISAAISTAVPVRKGQIFTVIPIYDLAGITRNTGQNAFPIPFTPQEVQSIADCYQPNDWNVYGDRCRFVLDGVVNSGLWGKLTGPWLSAIAEHPLAYAQHRLTVFNSFLRIGYAEPYYILHPGIDENNYGLKHPEPGLFRAFKVYVLSFENWPFFRPWFWLLGGVATAALALQRGGTRGLVLACVAGSGVVYLLTYAIFGLASDFRYAYWSILATLLTSFGLAATQRPPS